MKIKLQNYVRRVVTDGYQVQDLPRYGKCIVPNNPTTYRIREIPTYEPLKIINEFLEIRKDDQDDLLKFVNRHGLLRPEDYTENIGYSLGASDYLFPASKLHSANDFNELSMLVSENNRMFALKLLSEAFGGERRIIHRSGRVVFQEDYESREGLIFYSSSLYEYLISYAADQIINGKSFLACEQCFEYYLSSVGRGQKAKYCGGACRVAAHRERKS